MSQPFVECTIDNATLEGNADTLRAQPSAKVSCVDK